MIPFFLRSLYICWNTPCQVQLGYAKRKTRFSSTIKVAKENYR